MTDPSASPGTTDGAAGAPRGRRLGCKLLLSLVALLLALAVAEGMLHLLGVGAEAERLVRDPVFGWRNRPGWRGPVFSINSLGFLGDEFSPRKPEGAVRIFCLGGSCTAGDLLPDFDHTYPRHLTRQITSPIFSHCQFRDLGLPRRSSAGGGTKTGD